MAATQAPFWMRQGYPPAAVNLLTVARVQKPGSPSQEQGAQSWEEVQGGTGRVFEAFMHSHAPEHSAAAAPPKRGISEATCRAPGQCTVRPRGPAMNVLELSAKSAGHL